MKNSIEFVRKRAEFFFPNGEYSPEYLVAKMVNQGLLLGSSDIRIHRSEEVYIINFDKNWLIELDSPKDIFYGLISDPRLGVNSNYSEVLMTGFCEYYSVVTSDDVLVIENGTDSLNRNLKDKVKEIRKGVNKYALSYIFI